MLSYQIHSNIQEFMEDTQRSVGYYDKSDNISWRTFYKFLLNLSEDLIKIDKFFDNGGDIKEAEQIINKYISDKEKFDIVVDEAKALIVELQSLINAKE